MDSIWTKTARLPEFEALKADLKTDVLIIGGGLAGLLCAHALTKAHVDCALVEADSICSGITKNTTAKITSQHGLIYDRLVRTLGAERARLYLEANQRALRRYRALCREIDCDFVEQSAFVYARKDRRKLDSELEALSRLGFNADFSAELPLPFPVAGAVAFPDQAQFHPLKFAAHIAKGLSLFEHTKVLELMPGKAITTGGDIAAERIIVATHFPLLNKHGGYFMKLYQDRSYVLALKNAPALDGMYRDADEKGLSFRGWQDMLLLGGGSHRTGKAGGGWRELEAFARRCYPDAQIEARWAT